MFNNSEEINPHFHENVEQQKEQRRYLQEAYAFDAGFSFNKLNLRLNLRFEKKLN